MKRYLSKVIAVGMVCLCLASPAFAQTIRGETPESVARIYMEAAQAGDWAKCARLMHPEALAKVRKKAAALVASDPSGAKAALGLKSVEDFARLGDADVFERVMRRAMTDLAPQVRTAISSATSTIIGQVGESLDLVHVVYRTEVKREGASISKVDIMTLKKDGNVWRALLINTETE